MLSFFLKFKQLNHSLLGDANNVLNFIPGNNRDHPPAVFNCQFDVMRNCGCWHKVSGVQTQCIFLILQ